MARIEDPNRRGISSKHYDLGIVDGVQTFELEASTRTLHVPADFARYMAEVPDWKSHRNYKGGWDDVDVTLERIGGKWGTKNSFYRAKVATNIIGARYESRLRGAVEITLRKIDGVNVTVIPTPVIEETRITWPDVIPGMDIYLDFGVYKIEFFKRINTPAALKSISWGVKEEDASRLVIQEKSEGRDNLNKNLVATRGNKRRRVLEMNHSRTTPTVNGQGQTVYEMTEEATGRIFERNRTTGEVDITTNIEYPILIDAAISPNTTADDGQVTDNGSATWATEHSGGSGTSQTYSDGDGGDQLSGFRFEGITIPRLSTVSVGTITAVIAGVNSVSGDLAGDNTGDAPPFATGNNQLTWTSTIATEPSGTVSTTGTEVWDCASIVEEILAHASWVSGHDLRIGFINVAPPDGYMYIEAAVGSNAAPILNVTYTAPAAGGFEPQWARHSNIILGSH